MHSAQCTVSVGDVCAWGVPLHGRDCRVALRAPRNDPVAIDNLQLTIDKLLTCRKRGS
ncbi:MAG: hypothetical protein LBL66_00820 [Clostridiales bacterium]|nr:hypothetical protein [Clostridiales bacterium]